MKTHYPFPSINQFRHAIRDLKNRACYVGKDDNGDPVYDWTKPLPKVLFQGTVKLHGTNAAIVLDLNTHDIYAQSREHVISPEKDNAGFARWVADNQAAIQQMILRRFDGLSRPEKIVIFGEWAGKGVFSNVGVGQLPKMFIPFGAKHISGEEAEWAAHGWVDCPEINIYNIGRAPTYEVEIDLAYPEACLAKLEELTAQVGAECPFAKLLGATAENGPIIGEGIVWKPVGDLDYRFAFKVKDEKHQKQSISIKGLAVNREIQEKIAVFCGENKSPRFSFEFVD